MLYVVTALYCEAKPWIQTFALKKNTTSQRFQIFQNDSICLVITKQGKLNAAVAVTDMFHLNPPTDKDLLLNVGIAATTNQKIPLGTGYLCNKIIDEDTNHTYYPDVLFSHSFEECTLRTVSKPATSDIILECEERNKHSNQLDSILLAEDNIPVYSLIDMEASGVYTAATLFLKQHQLLFYKVVSDHCCDHSVSPEEVTFLLQDKLPLLIDYTDSICKTLSSQNVSALNSEEISLIQKVADALHFSVTMTHQLKQLFLYSKLNQANPAFTLTQLYEELIESPCNSKKEGKRYFERLKYELI